jgi:hypothetical protein
MSTTFEIEGKVHLISPTQQVTDNFRKRELVLFVENERNADYSDYIPFELKQDRVDLGDDLKEGESIKVSFNPRGRKWTKDGVDKFFPSYEAWRIEKLEAASDMPPAPEHDDPDNLPF